MASMSVIVSCMKLKRFLLVGKRFKRLDTTHRLSKTKVLPFDIQTGTKMVCVTVFRDSQREREEGNAYKNVV